VVNSTGWADPAQNKAERAMFGENFGARDPTAGELASNFSDKVLGNYDTEHIIMAPSKIKQFLGLSARTCHPMSDLEVLGEKDLALLKNQVPGWRLAATAEGVQSVRQEWKAKDAAAAQGIVSRFNDVVTGAGHPAVTLKAEGETVHVELSTPQKGGLTENDLIIAAKLNDVNVKDLLPQRRARYWA